MIRLIPLNIVDMAQWIFLGFLDISQNSACCTDHGRISIHRDLIKLFIGKVMFQIYSRLIIIEVIR